MHFLKVFKLCWPQGWAAEGDEIPILTFKTRSRFCFLQSRSSRREPELFHLIPWCLRIIITSETLIEWKTFLQLYKLYFLSWGRWYTFHLNMHSKHSQMLNQLVQQSLCSNHPCSTPTLKKSPLIFSGNFAEILSLVANESENIMGPHDSQCTIG